MGLIIDLFYAIAFLLAAPFLLIKSLRTGKYRSGWPARFGRGEDVFPNRPPTARVLLLHCVSVGELLSVQTLIQKLLAADPRLLIAISTTTDTGTARAETLYPADPNDPRHNPRIAAVRFPLDFTFALESFFDRVRPDAIALVELETWPMFLTIAHSRRIPTVIINGRLSERSFPRYMWIQPLMAAMLDKLDWIAVQTPTIANRFISLGASPDQVAVIPTLKYDNASFDDTLPGQHALAAAMGLHPDHQLFVAGSTGPGEEAPLLDAYLALREKHPALRLAIAPRKPETVPQVLDAINSRHLTPLLRTDHPDLTDPAPIENRKSNIENHEIFVLNTLGELKKLYALASFVFVGRSLVPLGGSDMIEAAALAKPTCFGPFTANFAEVVELLLNEKTAIEVMDGEELKSVVDGWLKSPDSARQMGQKARHIIRAQCGSTDLYVRRLLDLLSPSGAGPIAAKSPAGE
ncbi:MAG TPA: glycosyltransferase N-terminal domain-containing protein [Phycisphaerae bacterium]|nr:glycosyltransferase N-terminal domain-containing protein [Phycisphaerae bacterium]